eukprot:PRCOL_00006502-RA
MAFRRAVEAALDVHGAEVSCAAPGVRCWRVDVELPVHANGAPCGASATGGAVRAVNGARAGGDRGSTAHIGGAAGVQAQHAPAAPTRAGRSAGGGGGARKGSPPAPRSVEVLVFREAVLKTGNVHCDHCTYMGWTHHPVSQERFHFIVAAPRSPLDRALRAGGGIQSAKVARDALSTEKTTSHLLHGMVHSSGFGHLLRVNGRDGGSSALTGTDVMELWDTLCASLGCRSVSVKDVSTKYFADWRLMHTAAYGTSWYARWGYGFGRGSFGVRKKDYLKAADGLHKVALDLIRSDFCCDGRQGGAAGACGGAGGGKGKQVQQPAPWRGDPELVAIIDLYAPHYGRAVGASGEEGPAAPAGVRGCARTLGQLLVTMMAMRRAAKADARPVDAMEAPRRVRQVPAASSAATPASSSSGPGSGGGGGSGGKKPSGSRWSNERLGQARDALVGVLRAAGGRRVSRSDCRDGARARGIGDTGLLDHVLKSIAGTTVGERVVVRYVNPKSKMMEYRLERADTAEAVAAMAASQPPAAQGAAKAARGAKAKAKATAVIAAEAVAAAKPVGSLTRGEVLRDIVYVYYTTLAHYSPLENAIAADGGGAAAAAKARAALRGEEVDRHARVVLDTKLFVKDYGGGVFAAEDVLAAHGGAVAGVMAQAACAGQAAAGAAATAANGGAVVVAPHAAALPPPRPPLRVCCTVQLEVDAEAEEAAGGLAITDLPAGGATQRQAALLRRLAPAESLLVEPAATLGELKALLSCVYADMYTLPRGFALARGAPLRGLERTTPPGTDCDGLSLQSLGVCGTVVLRGAGASSWASDAAARAAAVVTDGWSSAGATWRVRCVCGARDDDGERMVSCEVCEVWVHTRCEGVPESDAPPTSFVCEPCKRGIARSAARSAKRQRRA